MADVQGWLNALKNPDMLGYMVVKSITGSIYPYIPILVGIILLLLAMLNRDTPSDWYLLPIFLPMLALEVWSIYVFIFYPSSQLSYVIALVGLVMGVVAVKEYVTAKEWNVRRTPL